MDKFTPQRGAGVLCHVSSLPNKYGIGSLGKEAYDWVDTLSKYKVKYWQILPLQQTGYGDSPYQSVSCNSGNPYFIDLVALKKQGLLDSEELQSAERKLKNDVDYGDLYEHRFKLLRRAYARFNVKNPDFVAFVESGEFEDYALFMSLKSRYGGVFSTFPTAYKYREHLAMTEFKNSVYKEEYLFWQFVQYEFDLQWQALKTYAHSKGVSIIGDIPLYVAYDSADVWSRPDLFLLDEDLNPVEVAGVPPDYFSEDGQLWGNPLYNWEAVKAEGFNWWTERIARAMKMYDIVRIDHFRGLDRYYAIPASAKTAREGEWREGPGIALFEVAARKLGPLPIIAEDLGVIDEGVVKLLEESGFPSMKVMMFAFDGEEDNAYLPQNIDEHSVVYTGTHDNDTALGFLLKMTDEQFYEFKRALRAALKYEGVYTPVVDRADGVRGLALAALGAKSSVAVIPVQDLMCLDNWSRMNTPAVPSGNWRFRMTSPVKRNTLARLKHAIIKTDR